MYIHVYDRMKQRRRISLICGLGRGGQSRVSTFTLAPLLRQSQCHLPAHKRLATRTPHARTHTFCYNFKCACTGTCCRSCPCHMCYMRRGKTSPEVVQWIIVPQSMGHDRLARLIAIHRNPNNSNGGEYEFGHAIDWKPQWTRTIFFSRELLPTNPEIMV